MATIESALFPGFRGRRANFRMATPVVLAHKIWRQVEHALRDARISVYCAWDAFGGIGVDAIVAAQHLRTTVLVTETDRATYELLCDNITFHGCAERVLPRCADAFRSCVECDVLYLDPPWGDAFDKSEHFDFFQYFRALLGHFAGWCAALVVKTPLQCGPTRPPFRVLYVYRSQKFRLMVWILLPNHAAGVAPSQAVYGEHNAHEHGERNPSVGQVTTEQPFARALHDQPKEV